MTSCTVQYDDWCSVGGDVVIWYEGGPEYGSYVYFDSKFVGVLVETIGEGAAEGTKVFDDCLVGAGVIWYEGGPEYGCNV